MLIVLHMLSKGQKRRKKKKWIILDKIYFSSYFYTFSFLRFFPICLSLRYILKKILPDPGCAQIYINV